jgi:hypothetical protein
MANEELKKQLEDILDIEHVDTESKVAALIDALVVNPPVNFDPAPALALLVQVKDLLSQVEVLLNPPVVPPVE